MKNINPLFLLIASLIVLFIAIFSFNKAQKQLLIEQEEYQEFKQLSLRYNKQRDTFSNGTNIIKRIQKLLLNSNIRNAEILHKNKKITIKISSLNINLVQKFINKILNERFNIIKLNIIQDKITLEIGVVK